MTAEYTLDVVRTIRRNAGMVPPQKLADTLGWSIAQLERIAAKHHIDLHALATPVLPDPLGRRYRPAPRVSPEDRHSDQFGMRLRPADAKIIREKAAARFMRPGYLVRRIVEGAIARGKVDDLVSAALHYRPQDPDAESQVG